MDEVTKRQEGDNDDAPPEQDEVIIELRPDDVLLGRGPNLVMYEGNIRFRKIVEDHSAEYFASNSRLIVKDGTARRVIEDVERRGGRFLRRMDSHEVRARGLVPAATDAWLRADPVKVLEKVKQAFRDLRLKTTGEHPNHPASSGGEPPSRKKRRTSQKQSPASEAAEPASADSHDQSYSGQDQDILSGQSTSGVMASIPATTQLSQSYSAPLPAATQSYTNPYLQQTPPQVVPPNQLLQQWQAMLGGIPPGIPPTTNLTNLSNQFNQQFGSAQQGVASLPTAANTTAQGGQQQLPVPPQMMIFPPSNLGVQFPAAGIPGMLSTIGNQQQTATGMNPNLPPGQQQAAASPLPFPQMANIMNAELLQRLGMSALAAAASSAARPPEQTTETTGSNRDNLDSLAHQQTAFAIRQRTDDTNRQTGFQQASASLYRPTPAGLQVRPSSDQQQDSSAGDDAIRQPSFLQAAAPSQLTSVTRQVGQPSDQQQAVQQQDISDIAPQDQEEQLLENLLAASDSRSTSSDEDDNEDEDTGDSTSLSGE